MVLFSGGWIAMGGVTNTITPAAHDDHDDDDDDDDNTYLDDGDDDNDALMMMKTMTKITLRINGSLFFYSYAWCD